MNPFLARVASGIMLVALLGCSRREPLPDPRPDAQFSYTVSFASGDPAEVFVDRSKDQVAVVYGRYGYLAKLSSAQGEGTLLDHQEKVYIPAKQVQGQPDPWSLELWKRYKRDQLLQILSSSLWGKNPAQIRNWSYELRPGQDFCGEPTIEIVSQHRENIGGPRYNIRLGKKTEGGSYTLVPNLGLVLDGFFEDGYVSGLKSGPVPAEAFAPPKGYKEKFGADELLQSKPKTPFDRSPPKGYTHIGGDWFREYDWEGMRVTQSRQNWIQDGVAHGWHLELSYYEATEDDLEKLISFMKESNERWSFKGFTAFDSTRREGCRQARLEPNFHLLQKGPRLLTVKLTEFGNPPGQQRQETNEATEQAFTEFLDRLARNM